MAVVTTDSLSFVGFFSAFVQKGTGTSNDVVFCHLSLPYFQMFILIMSGKLSLNLCHILYT
jgi:hypothetical protein